MFSLSKANAKVAHDMEEIDKKVFNQKSDLETQLNATNIILKNFEDRISKTISNLEENKLAALKSSFSEKINKLKEEIGKLFSLRRPSLKNKKFSNYSDFSSDENKISIKNEKGLLMSNIESIGKLTENKIQLMTKELAETALRFNADISKTREDFKESQRKSERDIHDLVAKNEKEIEMLRDDLIKCVFYRKAVFQVILDKSF